MDPSPVMSARPCRLFYASMMPGIAHESAKRAWRSHGQTRRSEFLPEPCLAPCSYPKPVMQGLHPRQLPAAIVQCESSLATHRVRVYVSSIACIFCSTRWRGAAAKHLLGTKRDLAVRREPCMVLWVFMLPRRVHHEGSGCIGRDASFAAISSTRVGPSYLKTVVGHRARWIAAARGDIDPAENQVQTHLRS